MQKNHFTIVSYFLQIHPVRLGPGDFACPFCNRIFTQKRITEEHMRIHTGEKPFICPHCDYSCAKKCNLVRHMKKYHEIVQ